MKIDMPYLTYVRITALHRDRASFSSSISDGVSRAYEVRVVHVGGGAARLLNYNAYFVMLFIIVSRGT